MILQAVMFYLFAVVAVASGVMVVAARNPVHSVLFLILTFFNAAGLFVLLGAEFLAMMLVVVYVGAVAVLFLFVVMMLDINTDAFREGFVDCLITRCCVEFIPDDRSLGFVRRRCRTGSNSLVETIRPLAIGIRVLLRVRVLRMGRIGL